MRRPSGRPPSGAIVSRMKRRAPLLPARPGQRPVRRRADAEVDTADVGLVGDGASTSLTATGPPQFGQCRLRGGPVRARRAVASGDAELVSTSLGRIFVQGRGASGRSAVRRVRPRRPAVTRAGRGLGHQRGDRGGDAGGLRDGDALLQTAYALPRRLFAGPPIPKTTGRRALPVPMAAGRSTASGSASAYPPTMSTLGRRRPPRRPFRTLGPGRPVSTGFDGKSAAEATPGALPWCGRPAPARRCRARAGRRCAAGRDLPVLSPPRRRGRLCGQPLMDRAVTASTSSRSSATITAPAAQRGTGRPPRGGKSSRMRLGELSDIVAADDQGDHRNAIGECAYRLHQRGSVADRLDMQCDRAVTWSPARYRSTSAA